MASAREVADRIARILQTAGAVPYVGRDQSQSAQPGYVVQVLPGGGAAGMAVRHLPPSAEAHRQVLAYRRILEREVLLPGLHVMVVLGPLDAKRLLTWHVEPP
jgi:hypothetical protein